MGFLKLTGTDSARCEAGAEFLNMTLLSFSLKRGDPSSTSGQTVWRLQSTVCQRNRFLSESSPVSITVNAAFVLLLFLMEREKVDGWGPSNNATHIRISGQYSCEKLFQAPNIVP